MFTFTDEQIVELTAIFYNDTSEPVERPSAAFYRAAADMAEGQDGVEEAAITWMRAAADINEGIGTQSAFIRDYNSAQRNARYGAPVSHAEMDEISDNIAREVLDDIVEFKTFPSIIDIARHDAEPAALELFSGDPSGWAGNPLFLLLGYKEPFYNNILDEGNPYDALAMIKFTAESYQVPGENDFGSLGDFFSQWVTYEPGRRAFDEAIFDLWDYLENAYFDEFIDFVNLSLQTQSIFLGRIDDDDVLEGDEFQNVIHAGGGDDIILASEGGDIQDGGAGVDTVDYTDAEAINFMLSSNEDTTVEFIGTASWPTNLFGVGFVDTLYNIEIIIGSSLNDVFKIAEDFDKDISLDGGEGSDTLDYSSVSTGVHISIETPASGGNAAIFSAESVDGAWTHSFTNFENWILTSQDDQVHVSQDMLDEGGITIDGGGEGPNGDTLDFSTLIVPAGSGTNTNNPGLTIDVMDLHNGTNLSIGGNTISVTGFENVVGTEGDDTIYTPIGGRIAAGGGDDTIVIVKDESVGLGPTLIWGGDGVDSIRSTTRVEMDSAGFGLHFVLGNVLYVNIPDITTDDFLTLDLEDLNIDPELLETLDAIIVNPENQDFAALDYTNYNWNPQLHGGNVDFSGYSYGGFTTTFLSIPYTFNGELYAGSDDFFVSQGDVGPNGEAGPGASVEEYIIDVQFNSEGPVYSVQFLSGFSQDVPSLFASLTGLIGEWANPGYAYLTGEQLYQNSLFSFHNPSMIYGIELVEGGFNYLTGVNSFGFEIAVAEQDSYNTATSGIDQVSYANSTAAVSVNLSTNAGIGGYAEGDQYFGIRDIIASKFDDTIVGDAAGNILKGKDGDDDLYGKSGADSLYGGEGNDTLFGGGGSDLFYFSDGDGQDTIGDFELFVDYIYINGEFLNQFDLPPNISFEEETNSEGGHNLVISYGEDDTITLLGVSLANWLPNIPTSTDGDDVIFGTLGSDTIISGDGNDTIQADKGDDLIIAGAGDDIIHASKGNDTIYAGSGNDTINANEGTNSIIYESGSDTVNGGIGIDTLDLSNYSSDQITFNIVGLVSVSNGVQYLVGGVDVTVTTPDGIITLGKQVYGSALGARTSVVEHLVFSDVTLDEVGIKDRALMDQFSDGDDIIAGSRQSDLIAAGAGNDIIATGAGDDLIIYESGNDYIEAGTGFDTVDLSKFTSDQVSFTIVGLDVFIETPDGMIELQRQVASPLGSDDKIVEQIVFSDISLDEVGIKSRALNDQITQGDDIVSGSIQDDIISAGAGNDTVQADGGNDTIVYTSGNDIIDGGQGGLDTLDLSIYAHDDVTFLRSGNNLLIDTPDGTIELPLQVQGSNYYNIEQMVFADVTLDRAAIEARIISEQMTDGDDLVYGTLASDTIVSGDGNDTIHADKGNDLIITGTGDDIIHASKGDDTIFAGSGNDLVFAEEGTNSIIYESGNDIVFGGKGTDTLDLSNYSSDQVSFKIVGGVSISNGISFDVVGVDVIVTTPDGVITLGKQVYGSMLGARPSVIEYLVFSDITLDEVGIKERALLDQFSDGDDTISGSRQTDRIAAGEGNDRITSGTGDDVFVFNIGDGLDTITDFEDGIDMIEFSNSGLGFNDLTISQIGGDTTVLYSVDGNGTPVDQITLSGINATTIDQDDFIFV